MNSYQLKEENKPLHEFVMDLTGKLQDMRINIDELKGVATVFGKMGKKYLSITIEQRDFYDIESDVLPVNINRKSSYKDEVKELYKRGFKQKEIAFRLNMSQPLVSKLLNSD